VPNESREREGSVVESIASTRHAAGLREDVRSWLEANWDEARPAQDWLGMLADTGYGWPTWPRDRYGLDLPNEDAEVVYEEFFKAGATPGTPVGHNGLTVRDFCTDDQARQFLRPLLTGERRWCQLFSEPSAGSDLAGLQTRAERHGDEWIVNGQKVWTSGAVDADYGILVARTDWDVPKHQGITMFMFPMKQAGVEVRPIRQMHGASTFNEVFVTDARMPHANMLGPLNGGWSVAMRTLSHERNRGRDAPRQAAEARILGRTTPAIAQVAVDYRKLAASTGRNADPNVRQQIAHLYSLQRIAGWTNMRSAAARKAGRPPGPEVSIGKLAGAQISRVTANLNALILGSGAMASDATPDSGAVVSSLLSYHSSSIAAGTDNVQKNIMGERVLGLPKDPQVDVDIPFKDTRRSEAVRRFGSSS
jgi:alkylation response protein AidB-like acyl-CoA dehydrogenase